VLYLASKYARRMREADDARGRGEALRAALLSNANLGGDCCNRGMLLGAILGCVSGADAVPRDLIDGLHRRGELLAVVDSFAERVARHLEAGPPSVTRFGRPSALPPRAYSAGDSAAGAQSGSELRLPTDFPGKIEAIAAHARAAGVPVEHMRYVRDSHTPFAVVPAGGDVAQRLGAGGGLALSPTSVLVPVPTAAAPRGHLRGLDAGDAARDRAQALAALHGTSIAAAAAQPSEPSGLTREQLKKLDASAGDAVHLPSANGVGVFFYAPTSELAATLGSFSGDSAGVSARLESNFGVRIDISLGAVAEERRAPACA